MRTKSIISYVESQWVSLLRPNMTASGGDCAQLDCKNGVTRLDEVPTDLTMLWSLARPPTFLEVSISKGKASMREVDSAFSDTSSTWLSKIHLGWFPESDAFTTKLSPGQ